MIPVQAHFANRDDWCTPADADRMEAKFKASGQPYRVFRYDSDHGFANEESQSYDPQPLSSRGRGISNSGTHISRGAP